MRDLAITNFKHGVINSLEPQSIPDGAASEALNWLSKGDKIELRRGSAVLGTEVPGLGRVDGLHVGYRADGTEVYFCTSKGNLYYFDTTDWVEVGSSLFGGQTTTLAASVSETLQSGYTRMKANGTGNIRQKIGQTFNSGAGGTLDTCKFYLQKDTGMTGLITAKLWELGNDSLPTGDALAVSDTYDIAAISDSTYDLHTFTFSGNQRYRCSASKNYGLTVEYDGTAVGVYIYVGDCDLPESSSGVEITYYQGTSISEPYWQEETGYDVCFYVYLTPFAEGEDVSFSNYATNAGAQVWVNSPNTSLYKIMVANPGSYTDMYDGTKNFKGHITIKQNRMWLWGRKEDKSGVYGSRIDTANYTTVTAEAKHNGDGTTKTFTGTLAFKAAGPKRTCFGVTFTDGTETFTDDYNGVLTGSAGGTGTINYTSGAYSITFNTEPVVGVNNITSTYQWEDSTNQGIADFSKSATRLAGEGFVFRQDDGGGDVQTIMTLGDTEYCFHENKTWALTLTATDTNAQNNVYRQNVGIPYMRAAVATSIGIFYIDVTDKSKPLFRRLEVNPGASDVLPRTVSLNVNLEGYTFDKCAMLEWNDYILFSGRTNDSTVNNRLFAYHKTWGSIDILDYYPSCLAIGNGTLLAGESISNNVLTLFSGFDDSDSQINNYWLSNLSDLKYPNRLKKRKKLVLEGEIQTNQSFEVYISNDRGGYTLIGTISGTGSYVDAGQAVHVGANTIGSKEVGGGGDGIDAYHYLVQLSVQMDKFETRMLKFVATGLGYCSITRIVDKDIRLYADKLPYKYR